MNSFELQTLFYQISTIAPSECGRADMWERFFNCFIFPEQNYISLFALRPKNTEKSTFNLLLPLSKKARNTQNLCPNVSVGYSWYKAVWALYIHCSWIVHDCWAHQSIRPNKFESRRFCSKFLYFQLRPTDHIQHRSKPLKTWPRFCVL